MTTELWGDLGTHWPRRHLRGFYWFPFSSIIKMLFIVKKYRDLVFSAILQLCDMSIRLLFCQDDKISMYLHQTLCFYWVDIQWNQWVVKSFSLTHSCFGRESSQTHLHKVLLGFISECWSFDFIIQSTSWNCFQCIGNKWKVVYQIRAGK